MSGEKHGGSNCGKASLQAAKDCEVLRLVAAFNRTRMSFLSSGLGSCRYQGASISVRYITKCRISLRHLVRAVSAWERANMTKHSNRHLWASFLVIDQYISPRTQLWAPWPTGTLSASDSSNVRTSRLPVDDIGLSAYSDRGSSLTSLRL